MIVRWLARFLAVGMLLFWGAFFVEHLWEWFSSPLTKSPPLKVWLGQFLHLALLLSYVVAMKWDLAGGCLIICSSALFFIWIHGIALTPVNLIFLSSTVLPGILLLVAWRFSSQRSIDASD